ncbi:DUF3703 domain-containing protein [Fodinicola acaciae]|uniref:DUF3703 domain-containing protein n=1 Tax=Fodinicola acaciae TaxID=2681555 RepID=UPI0013D6B9A9|nr:DUF3703 domain-containing protein [Fodinicola acaciae]
MTYEDAMDAGRTALAAGDWRTAYRHFGKAHGLGHDVLAQHLAAHRGMLRSAVRGLRPVKVVTQLFLMAGAYVFDRGPQGRSVVQ